MDRRSRIIVAFAILALIASGAIAQPAPEVKPFGDQVPVSVTELFPKTQHERSLETERGLKVEMVEMESGAVQVRTSIRIEHGDTSILEVIPDLETRTYTASRVEVSREALELLGFLPPAPDRILTPLQKLFGVSSCTRVEVLLRSHSGSAGVIRSTTATEAEWWFSDAHGFNCIDLYDHGASCHPAFGMSQISCVSTGFDDGSSHASVASAGSYAGAPGGTSISIGDFTSLEVTKVFGVLATGNWIIPSSEPLGIHVISTIYEVSCPYWV